MTKCDQNAERNRRLRVFAQSIILRPRNAKRLCSPIVSPIVAALVVWAAVGIAPAFGQLRADDWPMFRGPQGDGISKAKNIPTKWSSDKNIQWKVPLAGEGNGSPIVVGDRVFLTSATDAGGSRTLYCFSRLNGKQIWAQTVSVEKGLPKHKTNTYASSTPASDGKYVVVWHGSGGLHCYDMDGNEKWSRHLDEKKPLHTWGFAASPIIHEGRIFLNRGPGRPTFLTAVDLKSGKTIWRQDEPLPGNGVKRPGGGYVGTWATPVIAKRGGNLQVVCVMPTRAIGCDYKTGDVLWSCKGVSSVRGDLAYSSAHIWNDLCVSIGGFRGPSFAVKTDGTGDVTDSKRLWYEKSNPQSIGSGVALGDYLYLPFAGPSVIRCIDPKSGNEVWRQSHPGNFWGSLIYADGHCFVTDQSGTTHVFRPNPKKYVHVASNTLRGRCNSTPAVCNGQIFIRTFDHLYCIAEK